MTNEAFVNICKEKVLEYTNAHIDNNNGVKITIDDVFIVWICKTLQNHKAMVSTTVHDGMYYELTYNGDKKELYFDSYKKQENICFEGV